MGKLQTLKEKLSFLESRWFSRVSWVAAILSPLPLTAQLYKALTAASVEGIAIEAYSMLSIFHAIMICRGIKNTDSRIVTNFTLTSIIAASIAITALVRGGKFLFF